MLIGFVLLYLLASISIGLYAARRVKSSADYVVAGRSLPIYVTIATVFATWFGSETVLGIPATFMEEGLAGIISDPFGASLCLILVGLLFARPLYRMKLLTIGDFYRQKYGATVETIISLAICASYLGWVSAQIMALGLVFSLLSGGLLTVPMGMCIGTAIVLLYTLYGGMWSVALTDFMQMSIIVIGLIIIAFFISDVVGGPMVVIDHAIAENRFTVLPESFSWGWFFAFVAAWLTMGFGSIPQQDVFQRVMSAKDETTAVRGTVIGGVLYLLFAFIPIYLTYSALIIDAESTAAFMAEDSQRILPELILQHTPVAVQILFFGALLSAIMSTASGTLLAPSVIFTENILKPLLPKLKDKQLLKLIRFAVAGFAIIVLLIALNSELSIFEMVENAYKVTLAGAIVPLFAGIYWKRANTMGATLSIVAGIGLWLTMEVFAPEGSSLVPPQLAGFLASAAGMVIGGYIKSASAFPSWRS